MTNHEENRKRLCQWVTDQGVNPGEVPGDARIVVNRIDGTLSIETYIRAADGSIVPMGPNGPARRTITVPLKSEPPWIPPGAPPVYSVHR